MFEDSFINEKHKGDIKYGSPRIDFEITPAG